VGLIAAIIGAALVVLLVGCFLVVALSGGLPSFGSPSTSNQPTATTAKTVLMPNYLDPTKLWTCTEAKADALATYGLKATCVGKVNSATVNQVIDEAPAPGSSVKAGSTVQLIFSTGLAAIRVPNVIGQPYANATDTLTAAGFTVYPVTQYDDKYPSGVVIKTDPPSGTQVQPTSDANTTKVTVYVSKGPTPSPTTVPTVTPTPSPSPSPTATACPSGQGITPVPSPHCG
jgi:beta-lactam-binding protein with PASTA domain